MWQESRFRHVTRDASDVIGFVTGRHLNSKGKEEIDMCQAFVDIREEGRQKGRQEGQQEGRQEIISNMYESGMAIDTIASIVKISEDTIRQWLGLQDS